ncbi:hypothetical protein [Salipaludibacillus aurantiacus]|uniref:ParE toxin of type II toxin-antitoxin system, parDE n=1 Tax=Salipaludibacillus aurantiacus TaxID=1601833 RepID=A0A1H9UFX5_9BACI|nr:hypothetical protein [Salipaludibacillus aurantiacus]SES08171.1 hypothetical protein SAMN05518684_107182 [Salipaludibacillus aurantiacus]
MQEYKRFKIVYTGHVADFEEEILYWAEQEVRKGKPGLWCELADNYARQLTIISLNPYPEETNGTVEVEDEDETPPSLKHLDVYTRYPNFYRWGVPGRRTGDHRIIYAIHNFHKVILLYYFDKQYNGAIKRHDLQPAELNYEYYCI